MKTKTILLIAASLVLALVGISVYLGDDEGWEFVVDAEARSDGTVVATRQARASTCEDDGQGACAISWDWEGVSLPSDTEEWVKPYFMHRGATIPVTYIPYWCRGVDLHVCRAEMTDAGTVIEPSTECLAELKNKCGLEADQDGFWNAGALPKTDGGHYAFHEPLYAEWYDDCPLPPDTATPAPTQPTYTPQPTDTPGPTPTCRPTSTPNPTDTPYPTQTPLPTATPWPTQPPF